MRLLAYDSNDDLYVTDDITDNEVKPYAILSHTWGKDEDEVTFRDIGLPASRQKLGHRKIELCGKQAQQDGWQFFWVDTCCIDKTNHVELSKAITSMYRWYQQAKVCYVYLADVTSRPTAQEGEWQSSFRQSRWFTRGWTLQELLAPRDVVFYSKEWNRLGTKHELKSLIHTVTGISISALEGQPLSQFSIIERIRWTQGRRTKEKEDEAYCLLGIFGVYMYLNYGEGDNAFRRLQKELDAQSRGQLAESKNDHTFHNPIGLCLGRAPRIEANHFVGREDELKKMAETLSGDASNGQRQLVLGGMGGVGKTQLAIAYAQRHHTQYDSVFWINATSEATIMTSFQAIVERIPAVRDDLGLDDRKITTYVKDWLSHPRNTRWLLIFDNYDEPQTYDIRSFYPDTAYGTIIVTTRRPDLVAGEQLRLKPLQSLDEGLRILQTRSGRGNIEGDVGACQLAERLEGLPLALATAGTFLRKSAWTFQQYLDAYKERWNVSTRTPLILEYQDRTLYTTWELSYNRLKQEEPNAAKLLKLFAYFNHQALWYDLLHAGTRDDLPSWLRHIANDLAEFESIMHILVDYCFIETQITTQTYSIHSCVHDWIGTGLNKTLEPWSYWYAFSCVARSINGDDESLGHIRYSRLTLHAVNLLNIKFLEIRLQLVESNLEGAENIAQLLRGQVQLPSAATLLGEVLIRKQEVLGPDHTSTLATVHSLGALYHDQGKLAEAEQMYKRALSGQEKALGPDHTSTLASAHALGLLYHDQGKLAEAEQMYKRALAGEEKALGPDHTSTLTTVHNLGTLYYDQGKLAKAEQIYTRALAGTEKALGPDHTSTLTTVFALGALYQNQGKLAKAEQIYTRALAGEEKALGPDHTSTLTTVHALGLLYRDQGKLAKAEQMYKRALSGMEKALGPDHISTLITVHSLGALYHDQGKLVKAEQFLQRAATGMHTALGSDHDKTKKALKSLEKLRVAVASEHDQSPQVLPKDRKRDRLKRLLRI